MKLKYLDILHTLWSTESQCLPLITHSHDPINVGKVLHKCHLTHPPSCDLWSAHTLKYFHCWTSPSPLLFFQHLLITCISYLCQFFNLFKTWEKKKKRDCRTKKLKAFLTECCCKGFSFCCGIQIGTSEESVRTPASTTLTWWTTLFSHYISVNTFFFLRYHKNNNLRRWNLNCSIFLIWIIYFVLKAVLSLFWFSISYPIFSYSSPANL